MIDVSEVMADPDFVRSFIVRRPGAGAFDASGVWVAGPYSDIPVVGAIQPATPAEVVEMPSGTNIANVISVWSATEMKADASDGTLSDVIVDGAKSYRVVKIEERAQNGYFRVFAEGYVT